MSEQSVELKPGFFRQRDGGTAEVLAERNGRLYGIDSDGYGESWDCNGVMRGAGRKDFGGNLAEYLGPTLPPEPGEGYRLLRKWPEVEDYFGSDDFWKRDVEKWERVSSLDHQHLNHGRQPEGIWFRRRVAPEPPTPPEGWEVLPDGTPGSPEYMRFATDEPDRGWHICCCASLSGQYGDDHDWYARRITPEPQWTPTMDLRLGKGSSGVRLFTTVGMLSLQQRWTCGDEEQWRDVEVPR